MRVSREMAAAVLRAVREPAGGLVRMRGGKVWLFDRVHAVYRPVALLNGSLSILEGSEQ
jgi:hypothetical protein